MLRVLALVLGGSAFGVVQKLRDDGGQAHSELDLIDQLSQMNGDLEQRSGEGGQEEVLESNSVSSLLPLASMADGRRESDLPTLFATLIEDSDPRLIGLLHSENEV
jgi:hypothetical protein